MTTTRDPFLEDPEKSSHPESHNKVSNPMITEPFNSHILRMNWSSLNIRSSGCRVRFSIFRYRYLLKRNGSQQFIWFITRNQLHAVSRREENLIKSLTWNKTSSGETNFDLGKLEARAFQFEKSLKQMLVMSKRRQKTVLISQADCGIMTSGFYYHARHKFDAGPAWSFRCLSKIFWPFVCWRILIVFTFCEGLVRWIQAQTLNFLPTCSYIKIPIYLLLCFLPFHFLSKQDGYAAKVYFVSSRLEKPPLLDMYFLKVFNSKHKICVLNLSCVSNRSWMTKQIGIISFTRLIFKIYLIVLI